MIIDKYITLKISSKIKGKLKQIGIDSNYGEFIILPIEKLWLNSNYEIKVKCDICGEEKYIKYKIYNQNIIKYNIYCCSNKCATFKNKKTCLEKYGDENYNNKEKRKKTCLEKYGNENSLMNQDVKNKSKKTCLEKYGDENYNNREKFRKTCLEKYGVESPLLNNDVKNKSIKTCLEKYGVEDPRTLIIIKEKRKKTCIEKYGVDNYSKSLDYNKKVKKTCLEKYGVDSSNKSQFIKNKKILSMLNKYGYISNSITEESKLKLRTTNMERYGVEYPMQVAEFFDKQQKNAKRILKYNDKLYYQGSYEKNFLDHMNNNNLLNIVERGFMIEYIYDNEVKKYFPDFFIQHLNLIVEIKSNYTYNKYLDKNIMKKNTCIKLGYNYLFIIDKNYSVLNKILNISC